MKFHMKSWKLTVFIAAVGFFLSGSISCNKYSFEETSESTFLEVEEVNSSALFHYSSTDDLDAGSTGYDQMENYLAFYDSTDALGTITLGSVGIANNDTIFLSHVAAFGVPDSNTFHANFNPFGITSAISTHRSSAVIANAACDLTVGSSTLTLKTTTQFFQSSQDEDFYITPYIVVDSLLAAQAGHPDTPMTYHRKVIVDVARLPTYPVRYLGYKIAGGDIHKGYKVNLTFEAPRVAAWSNPEHISVILVITKQNGGVIEFVNASTNF